MPPLSQHISSAYYKASLAHDYQELTDRLCTHEDFVYLITKSGGAD